MGSAFPGAAHAWDAAVAAGDGPYAVRRTRELWRLSLFTISPNENHSVVVLKLSRARRNDPGVKHSSEDWQRLAGADFPTLDATSQDLELEFPEYDLRCAATARDPLAVIEGFRVHLLLRLATALGTRMCPRCPRCNADRGLRGCQDKFGCNMRPLGGACLRWEAAWSIRASAHLIFTPKGT